MIGIDEVAYYLPKRRVTIADLAQELGLSDKDVFLHTTYHGQREIAYDPQQTLQDLLTGALDKLLDSPKAADHKIKHLFYTHTVGVNQDPLKPVLGEIIRRYDLRECSAMAVTQANCASGVMALKYAKTVLEHGEENDAVLILCGDRGIGSWRVQPGNTITGDGAAAALITKNATKNYLITTNLKIDSRFYMGFHDPKIIERFNEDHPRLLTEFLTDSVKKGGRTFDEVKFILPHNINRTAWLQAAKNLGLDRSKVYLKNVPKTGHCFTADNFINLRTAEEDGSVQPGDLCLCVSLGSGFFYTSALIQC